MLPHVDLTLVSYEGQKLNGRDVNLKTACPNIDSPPVHVLLLQLCSCVHH